MVVQGFKAVIIIVGFDKQDLKKNAIEERIVKIKESNWTLNYMVKENTNVIINVSFTILILKRRDLLSDLQWETKNKSQGYAIFNLSVKSFSSVVQLIVRNHSGLGYR